MKTTSRSKRLVLLLAITLMSLIVALPAQAAPHISGESHRPDCVPAKHIQNWHSVDQLERLGFNTVVEGDQASVHFNGDLSLNLAQNPSNTQSQASRITEIDADLPIAQRVKCWQAAPGRDVVVEFRERFDQSATPMNLEEDLFLWNAPLAGPNNPEPPQLLTAIGVSRSSAFGTPMYVAEVVQDLDLTTFSGLFELAPLPSWLNPAAWHNVRITLSQTYAKIEVAQGNHPFTLALRTALPHPAEPLGFEFSMDTSQPIVTADGLNISCLDIRKVPSVLSNLPIRPSLCRK